MKRAFDHVGLWTSEPQPGEFWVDFSKVWVTNPRAHPQRIEYLQYTDLTHWFGQPNPPGWTPEKF